MLMLPEGVRVFALVEPVDMRCQFDGLANAVREIDAEPDTGHLYVFASRRRHLIKILFFDQQGYCLLSKRLESGTFPFPKDKRAKLEISVRALEKLLSAELISQDAMH